MCSTYLLFFERFEISQDSHLKALNFPQGRSPSEPGERKYDERASEKKPSIFSANPHTHRHDAATPNAHYRIWNARMYTLLWFVLCSEICNNNKIARRSCDCVCAEPWDVKIRVFLVHHFAICLFFAWFFSRFSVANKFQVISSQLTQLRAPVSFRPNSRAKQQQKPTSGGTHC